MKKGQVRVRKPCCVPALQHQGTHLSSALPRRGGPAGQSGSRLLIGDQRHTDRALRLLLTRIRSLEQLSRRWHEVRPGLGDLVRRRIDRGLSTLKRSPAHPLAQRYPDLAQGGEMIPLRGLHH